ncbi:MAG: hypothetical protein ABJN40_03735 [Sneathiella sp.]
MTPSAPAEGKVRGRKLILKAANDNRPPLSEQLFKLFLYGSPLAAGVFLGLLWYLA